MQLINEFNITISCHFEFQNTVAMRTLFALLAIAASQAGEVLNPAQRTIMKLKQLYLEKSGDWCEENPLRARECDACNFMRLGEREACCADLTQYSDCLYQLIPLMREWEIEGKEEMGNQIPQMPDTEENVMEPERKRYIARWGLTKSQSPAVQWGKPIKRYGMASGRRFNFNKFKEGSYAHKPSRK